jgi:hypothetical protein
MTRKKTGKSKVVVCGYMIRSPLAGMMLAYFHYLVGLHRLGHEVVYLEESGWPRSCYNPINHEHTDDPGIGLRTVRSMMARFQLKIPVYYVDRESGAIYGTDLENLKSTLLGADLLLNIGGVCWLPEFYLCGRRALIDMDPLFTQIGQFGGDLLSDHHVHFSYGTNIGHNGCTIPTLGINWYPTLPPVVPEVWQNLIPYPETPAGKGEPPDLPFTTIANWNAYGGITYRGQHYGQKDEEFLRMLELPSRVLQTMELTVAGIDGESKKRLRCAGWMIRHGKELTGVSTYQNYIAGSRGEFSVAKHAYVKTRSGWFSDRSVCYLAAGRPVVLQDTGFTDRLPTGKGLLAFNSLEEAVESIERINADYYEHRIAARLLAEETFASDVVLPPLLETAML